MQKLLTCCHHSEYVPASINWLPASCILFMFQEKRKAAERKSSGQYEFLSMQSAGDMGCLTIYRS